MSEQPQQSADAVPAVPNPGSGEAIALGCQCAVLDNNHGRTPPWPPDGWYITGGCPVHHPHLKEAVA